MPGEDRPPPPPLTRRAHQAFTALARPDCYGGYHDAPGFSGYYSRALVMVAVAITEGVMLALVYAPPSALRPPSALPRRPPSA